MYAPVDAEDARRLSAYNTRRNLVVGVILSVVMLAIGAMIGTSFTSSGTSKLSYTPPRNLKITANDSDIVFVSEPIKYPALIVIETYYNDTTRSMSTGNFGPPGVNDTTRIIPITIVRPATGPGTVRYVIPFAPFIYNGSYTGQGLPLVTSQRDQLTKFSWRDTTAAPGPFPVIFIPDRLSYADGIRRAEQWARAGFIVVMTYSHRVIPYTCPPLAGFCGALIGGANAAYDLRAVKNAIKANLISGLPWSDVRTMSTGWPALGCQGASAGTAWCLQASIGFVTPPAGAPPGMNVTDYDFQSLMTGDFYSFNTLNFDRLNMSVGFWSSSTQQDANVDFGLFNGSRLRVFYDVTFDHLTAAAPAYAVCDRMEGCNRVYKQGVQTAADNYVCGAVWDGRLGEATGHCNPNVLDAFALVPSQTTALYPNEAQAQPYMPTIGIPPLYAESESTYYHITYFWHTLYESPLALVLTQDNIFREQVLQIYVNSTPGYPANDFNLRSKKVQIDMSACRSQDRAFLVGPQGNITVPPGSTVPTAFQVAWNDIFTIHNLSFPFPVKFGGVMDTITAVMYNSNGFIFPLGRYTLSMMYAPRHLERLFMSLGHPVLACFGTDLFSTANSSVSVLNTPTEFTITVLNAGVRIWQNLGGKTVNFQCSLYPNGTRTIAFDSTAPTSVPIPAPTVASNTPIVSAPSIVVGWTTGRGLVDPNSGDYEWWNASRWTTWASVLNSTDDGSKADAIFEVYNGAVAPKQAGVNLQLSPFKLLKDLDGSDADATIPPEDPTGCPEGNCELAYAN